MSINGGRVFLTRLIWFLCLSIFFSLRHASSDRHFLICSITAACFESHKGSGRQHLQAPKDLPVAFTSHHARRQTCKPCHHSCVILIRTIEHAEEARRLGYKPEAPAWPLLKIKPEIDHSR
ncbi:unnamed protein product [Pleuronectes platessa]|uniref:Secreted protein n=1 Tax=Pleuronectes platessa TaxID=8262 RepID=A0A9N7TG89_PLEPL|nr:unnamed protein product [Pleuronectes platessa]